MRSYWSLGRDRVEAEFVGPAASIYESQAQLKMIDAVLSLKSQWGALAMNNRVREWGKLHVCLLINDKPQFECCSN